MPEPFQARYRQLASAIESDITVGRLKVGDQIPSERAMAERMGVSRMTARKALQELTSRGMLETRVGQGTFVSAPVIQQELSSLSGFTEEMERQGRQTSSIIVEAERRPATAEATRALDLPPLANVYRLTRVRLADGTPVALERTEIDARLTPDLLSKADFAKASLYKNLKTHFGILPATAEQTLEAAVADQESSLSLHVPIGDPILRQTRLTRDANGIPIEFVRSTYRGDAFVMKIKLSIGSESAQ